MTLRRVQNRGLIPLNATLASSLSAKNGLFSKLNVVDFTERLAPLLTNITLERALGIISDGQGNSVMAATAADLRRGLHEGRKLSELIRRTRPHVPQLYAGVVEAGSQHPAQVMGELRRFLEKAEGIKVIHHLFLGLSGLHHHHRHLHARVCARRDCAPLCLGHDWRWH